ncbi:hypothetical protein D3C76_1856710 [compost metagenome]
MRHYQQRRALTLVLADAFKALVLKVTVAHRQCLVDDQDIRTKSGRHGKRHTHLHAA